MNISKPLASYLVERAQTHPKQLVLTFSNNQGAEEKVTAELLHAEAVTAAKQLAGLGVGFGDHILLILPHSRALIAAFWGALYLGAVPAILPDHISLATAKIDNLAKQIEELAAQTEAKVVVTPNSITKQLSANNTHLCCTDLGMQASFDSLPISVGNDLEIEYDFANGHEPVYLQHSSGTTGQRKAAILSHKAIAHSLEGFIERLQINNKDVIVSWLPLYHDFGLFAGMVLPLVLGIPLVLLSPFTVVRRPETLLWAVDRHAATLSWIFNSGYHLIAQKAKAKRLKGLNLSSLRVLGCGGEPVRYESQNLFLQCFKAYGFRESALVAGYGLAETVMCVTSSFIGKRAPVDWVDSQALLQFQQALPQQAYQEKALAIISCGKPLHGVDARIIDSDGNSIPERRIGELQIRGPVLFDGYHRPNEDSNPVSHIPEWFSTGDLGYFFEGQFYFCGRKKDLIVVGGRNVNPQQLEAIAHSVLSKHVRRLLAFGLFNKKLGTELPIIVCEESSKLEPEHWNALVINLRQQTQKILGIALKDVRLVPRRWIAITTSGKLARSTTRQKYQDEGYADTNSIGLWPFYLPDYTVVSLIVYFQSLFEAYLCLPKVDPQASFIDLGIDSLQFVKLITVIEESLGKSVPIEEFVIRPNITELAKLMSPLLQPKEDSRSGKIIPSTDNSVISDVSHAAKMAEPHPSKKIFNVSKNKLKQYIVNVLRQGGIGPIKVPISYKWGTRLLMVLTGQSWLKQRLYQTEIELLNHCLSEVMDKQSIVSPSLIQQNLMVNSWQEWRTQQLRKQNLFNRWVTIKGKSIIERSFALKQGIIIAIPHTKLKNLLWDIPIFQHRKVTAIGNLSADLLQRIGLNELAQKKKQGVVLSKKALYSAQLYRAKQVLNQGGVVIITPDFDQGQTGIRFPFHGRWRNMQTGMADLALQTGAEIIPTFATLQTSGHVHFEFMSPLSLRENTSDTQQIKSLIFQYTKILSDNWLSTLSQLEWYMLEAFLQLPKIKSQSSQSLDELSEHDSIKNHKK